MRWGVDVQQVMKEAKATDANTVVVDFMVPAPRFFFFMTYKYDIGVYIVPKHIFAGPGLDDVQALRHRQGLAGHAPGPWKVADASLQQKVFDRRPEWWAVKAGLAPLPAIERTIWLPFAGEQATAQALITNQLDAATGIQPATFPTRVPRQPEDHHAHRPEAAVRLRRLVADLALRQQRGEAVRRQGRALGAVALHRPAAVDRGRLSRCLAGVVAADAALIRRCSRISTR